jgi:hypothetical protein
VICVAVIYLVLVIYARFKDKKDIEKLGVTQLPDNHKSDQYFYQIIVFTGQRKNAGTKSNVRFHKYKNLIVNSSHRFILQYRVMMMKRMFVRSLILIDKFYNVVESMHL